MCIVTHVPNHHWYVEKAPFNITQSARDVIQIHVDEHPELPFVIYQNGKFEYRSSQEEVAQNLLTILNAYIATNNVSASTRACIAVAQKYDTRNK